MRNNVLHVAVHDVVLGMHKEVADEACYAQAGEKAFVPARVKENKCRLLKKVGLASITGQPEKRMVRPA